MQVTIDIEALPCLVGYEPIGFKEPLPGERFVDSSGVEIVLCRYVIKGEYRLIVRKIQKWRPATIADIDKALRCRVSDRNVAKSYPEWITAPDMTLTGWSAGEWCITSPLIGAMWKYCEVLDNE